MAGSSPEHAAVARWVEEAVGSLAPADYWKDVDLKSLPSGRALLEADPEQARTYVLAAVEQVRHWDGVIESLRAEAEGPDEVHDAGMPAAARDPYSRQRQAAAVAAALLRRALPLTGTDLIGLLDFCSTRRIPLVAPFGHVTRALERYASEHPIDADLRDAAQRFAARLRASHDKNAKRLGTTVEQLCGAAAAETSAEAAALSDTPMPAAAGAVPVLAQLKSWLEIAESEPVVATTEIGPDRFALRDDTPLRREHEWLGELFSEVAGTPHYSDLSLPALAAGRALLALDPAATARLLLAAAERHVAALLASPPDLDETALWQSQYATAAAVRALAERPIALDRSGLFDWLLYLSVRPTHERTMAAAMPAGLLTQVEREAASAPLTEGERYVLHLWRASLIAGPPLGTLSEELARVGRCVGDGAVFHLVPGDAWSDAVNADLCRLPPAEQRTWAMLLRHLLTATSARPSAKWLNTAARLVGELGPDDVQDAVSRWLPLVARGSTARKLGECVGDTRAAADVMHEENATCLRGLLWLVPTLPDGDALIRLVSAVALSAYRRVPGVGPRAVKVGNAALYSLSAVGTAEAVGQLAMLKARVRFSTAQKEVEKAFDAAARALALPRDQIEEIGVPSYGLEEVGRRSEVLGRHRAEIVVTGSDADLRWLDPAGRPLRSIPAAVKKEHGEQVKELQQALKDIQAMLPAQRDRIDSLCLARTTWPLAVWRERYLEHPLVGTIARRLIWCLDATPVVFVDGRPIDVGGASLEPAGAAEVALWHPVGRPVDEITAWRRRLESLGITQPFKQAHRETYLLTDAERRTETYSNRFAAHILRQHQFAALCAARGWTNKLRLLVDAEYPPATRELRQWGLRAEFWIDGVGADYNVDTNASGAFLRVATDQVRFYRDGAAVNQAQAGSGGYAMRAPGPGVDNINEPLPLASIPPLVFSEIMRDVDLFVGVASVGNDPVWQDGGPGGRYRDYWHAYSFGELSESAATRREVLKRLVPRLKIADRCTFDDRFLVVRGDKRTYRIHMGSGNILMEPSHQYLCIVPDPRARSEEPALPLPFEGDAMLSVVLSKAFLLADDASIVDPSIVRQIDAG